MIKLGSWYSGGVDAFSYAAHQLGIEVSYCIESDLRAHKYLKNNYPGTPIYNYDEGKHIKTLNWTHIIAGGDPCQPSSNAGVRKGKRDYRYRWPAMYEGIKLHKPHWVINENVTGSISNLVLDQKIADLEKIGYTAQAYSLPAAARNAEHTRQRVFLVAHSNVQRWGELLHFNTGAIQIESKKTTSLGTQSNAFLQFEERTGEPAIFPVYHEIPDQIARLGFVGNSIVPDFPMIFLELIKQMYESNYIQL